MFQIGFPELLTLLVLMLLLVGPKRLPEVTKFFIQIWSKLRSQYEKISNEINNEIGTEEIKKERHYFLLTVISWKAYGQ